MLGAGIARALGQSHPKTETCGVMVVFRSDSSLARATRMVKTEEGQVHTDRPCGTS